MRILAFSIAHDASVCVFNDGVLEFFCKEERISSIKRDRHPFKSLQLFLQEHPESKIDHVLYCTPTVNEREIESVYRQYIRKLFHVDMENYSDLKHHDCHAQLAAMNSGFDKCLVFVIDRNGSLFFVNNNPAAREAESVYISDRASLSPVYKNFWVRNSYQSSTELSRALKHYYKDCEVNADSTYSVVKVYEAATTMIGQNQLENGKTMGLSSYGVGTGEILFSGDVPLSHKFTHMSYDEHSEVCFRGKETKITHNVDENNYTYYANLAKDVQQQTQDVCLNLINKWVAKTGIHNVCLVGGYALNIVANNHYLKNLPNINFYFEPVADDTGITIGACALKHYELTGEMCTALHNNFYHYYDHNEQISSGVAKTTADVVELLLEQKSVGIFNSSPEVGPRALGHRSILFDARNLDCKSIVNKIKKREWYRPFAGIILKDHFNDYFHTEGLQESPYMTVNFYAKPIMKEQCPGIVHVDNTCRIQTVDESDGFLYALLKTFYDRTGCPVLLNTSLNLAGNPLIQTKQDALKMIGASDLDYMYFVEEGVLCNG